MSERADHCHGSYVLHLYCCAPNDIVLGIACNAPAEFTGNSLKEALSAAKGAGWHTHVTGLAAWCPTHTGSHARRALRRLRRSGRMHRTRLARS